jgi:hypothetical protein
MRERAGVCLVVTGEGSFEALVAVVFLPLALILLFWRARLSSLELGTSRVVGEQGESGEAKVSSGQTRLRTRWREVLRK